MFFCIFVIGSLLNTKEGIQFMQSTGAYPTELQLANGHVLKAPEGWYAFPAKRHANFLSLHKVGHPEVVVGNIIGITECQ